MYYLVKPLLFGFISRVKDAKQNTPDVQECVTDDRLEDGPEATAQTSEHSPAGYVCDCLEQLRTCITGY